MTIKDKQLAQLENELAIKDDELILLRKQLEVEKIYFKGMQVDNDKLHDLLDLAEENLKEALICNKDLSRKLAYKAVN